MSSVTVHRGRPDDAEAIVALAGRTWRAAYGDFSTRRRSRPRSGSGTTREAIESERVGYFVATDGEIVSPNVSHTRYYRGIEK